MHLPIIWIERIPLLQVYFSHFIAKQGTVFKDIYFKQSTQFFSTCSSSGLIYFIFVLLYFFYQIIVCLFFGGGDGGGRFWRNKIRRHLVKGVIL